MQFIPSFGRRGLLIGAKRAKVKAVEKADALNADAQEPVWSQEGATLRLSGDGQSFGYRIVFE